MAIISGTFTSQNKKLPGVYINVVSTPAASTSNGVKGTVAVALPFTWGVIGKHYALNKDQFESDSIKLFGYASDSSEMLALREIFCNAGTALVYRVCSAKAKKASNTYATALYVGSRGNDIKIVITNNVNNENKYDVNTYMDGILVDTQTVASASELTDNEYVTFNKEAQLAETAGTPLTGGDDGDALTVSDYQTYLDKLESQSFTTLVCPVITADVVELFKNYTKRLRNDLGVRFKLVVYKTAADFEGVINVDNSVSDDVSSLGMGEHGLVYWVAGADAGCDLNRSLTNKAYDGELTINTEYTVADLTANKVAGKFTLYNAGDTDRVLEDINSFISFNGEKGKEFSLNQAIRAIDALCNAISAKFASDYQGIIPNDDSGRTSLWTDVCNIINGFVSKGVFSGFSSDMVSVEAGEELGDVVCTVSGLTIVYTMSKLYLTISIK